MNFRTIRANEIQCRVGSIWDGGFSLLLYKDSRVDMAILDETVGAKNWQRDHKELKGNIYCGIGIYNPDGCQWVWKWDAGAESYTEKEKGEASDSFKRAATNWGIGRELYTAPFISFRADTHLDGHRYKLEHKKDAYGFSVGDIEYSKDRRIKKLIILKDGAVVWRMDIDPNGYIDNATYKQIATICDQKGVYDSVCAAFAVEDLHKLKASQVSKIMEYLNNV